MRYRMKYCGWKLYLFSALMTNLVIAFVMWLYLDSHCQNMEIVKQYALRQNNAIQFDHTSENFNSNISEQDLSQKFLVLIRDFETFDNDITDSVTSILKVLPHAKILLISDRMPYPPLKLFKDNPSSNIHMVALKSFMVGSSSDLCPNSLLDRDHILVVPDSVRLDSLEPIVEMFKLHLQNRHNTVIVAPFVNEPARCMSLNISIKQWTMKYRESTKARKCNLFEGKHVLLLTKSLLLQLQYPFARPFPRTLYTQLAQHNVKVEVAKNLYFEHGRVLYTDSHYKWKRETFETSRLQNFYRDFGIKKVFYLATKIEWYGCNKDTARCFGTVIDDMPEYLFEGRWTPPCCLENLRKTARYVFSILDKCEVRYWLEGGSLLGAARNGDIIPWDYDVDIGIYKDDIKKCEWLKNSQKQSIVDSQGFVWEKADEGDFIRVQYSQSNHLHVDIFPFYSKNGIMTKNTWLPTHKQDTEFPEYYLKPLEKIKFVGVYAWAPNNYKEFLHLKFGKGVIESPQYPVPEALNYQLK